MSATTPGDDRGKELAALIERWRRKADNLDSLASTTCALTGRAHDRPGPRAQAYARRKCADELADALAAPAETGGHWDRERLAWETTCPDCGQLVDTVLAQHDETPDHTCGSSLAPAPPPPVELATPTTP